VPVSAQFFEHGRASGERLQDRSDRCEPDGNHCLAIRKPSIAAVNRYLADDIDGALRRGCANRQTGARTHTAFDAR